jgi:hypothetical protein
MRATAGQISLVAALTLLGALPMGGVASAGSPGFLRGTWLLQEAYEIQPDGTPVYPYGKKPQGILMVDGEGRYTVEIYGETRPKFSTPTPTPEQYQTAFLSISVHAGTAEVDEAHHLLTFHVGHNANPDRDMTVQQRPYVLKGDLLTYRVPAAAEGKINTPISVWQHVAMQPPRAERPSSADGKAPDL